MRTRRVSLRAWEFAGLMTTYWCNARCAFCYVHSSDQRGGHMSPTDAVAWWQQLDRVAAMVGKRARVHITGGEPFGDFEHLCSILAAIQQAGLGPVEKLETNAFWAIDDHVVKRRLDEVRKLGVEALVVSTDVYHQEFVPIERVRRCVRIGREVFGPDAVKIRWPEELDEPSGPPGRDQERADAFRRAYRRHRERLTGRAAFALGPVLPHQAVESLAGLRCKRAILKSRHVHIDPYGNVFPGVCTGIVLGNASQEPVDEIWRRLDQSWQDNPILDALVRGGPFALMQTAVEAGYKPLADGYAGKCHLCTHVRQWLFDHGGWEQYLGPAECYRSADTVESAT